jgi:hypothetical protein
MGPHYTPAAHADQQDSQHAMRQVAQLVRPMRRSPHPDHHGLRCHAADGLGVFQ